MAQGHSTAANQLPRSVVALNCDADVSFCRALVEELAQQHPGHIYRINPDPIPHNSFSIRVELESNFGQLIWKNGAGERVSAESHNYVEFAKYIIARANPQLEQALNKALHDAD